MLRLFAVVLAMYNLAMIKSAYLYFSLLIAILEILFWCLLEIAKVLLFVIRKYDSLVLHIQAPLPFVIAIRNICDWFQQESIDLLLFVFLVIIKLDRRILDKIAEWEKGQDQLVLNEKRMTEEDEEKGEPETLAKPPVDITERVSSPLICTDTILRPKYGASLSSPAVLTSSSIDSVQQFKRPRNSSKILDENLNPEAPLTFSSPVGPFVSCPAQHMEQIEANQQKVAVQTQKRGAKKRRAKKASKKRQKALINRPSKRVS
ncbi:hypothetical protein MMC07_005579 [Pseudocyphellaria aurata]|nr:hypothetical protein [Pseudocyphellaria aurata]